MKLLWITFLFLFSACREDIIGSGGSINNGNAGDPPVGVVDDVAGFYMRVYDGSDIKYYMHKAGTDFDDECVVATDETDPTKKDITCVVDIPEEDLRFHGVSLQYNVPSTMCDYVWYMPYYFENYQLGIGPTALYYDIDRNGAICNDLGGDNDGTCDAGELLADYTTSGLIGDTPTCAYDFSAFDGPNCCVGSYVVTGRDWNSGANAYTIREAVYGEWGGDPGSCLQGPAIETQAKASSGWPLADIFYVKGEGLNKTYEPSSPIEKQVGNVYLANYFDPTDHTSPHAGYPAALNNTSRYYELRCLDRAHELNARIRVQIREWNEYSEWLLGATGDPDTTGTEADFPGFDINDFYDWANYVVGGIDTFPNFESQ
jgi:hypothetical protein